MICSIDARVVLRAAPEVEKKCLPTIAGAKVLYEICSVGDADAEGLSGRPVPDIQRDTRGTPRLGQPSFSMGILLDTAILACICGKCLTPLDID